MKNSNRGNLENLLAQMQGDLPKEQSEQIKRMYQQMSTQIKEVCGEQADDPQSAEMKKLLLLGMIKE